MNTHGGVQSRSRRKGFDVETDTGKGDMKLPASRYVRACVSPLRHQSLLAVLKKARRGQLQIIYEVDSAARLHCTVRYQNGACESRGGGAHALSE